MKKPILPKEPNAVDYLKSPLSDLKKRNKEAKAYDKAYDKWKKAKLRYNRDLEKYNQIILINRIKKYSVSNSLKKYVISCKKKFKF